MKRGSKRQQLRKMLQGSILDKKFERQKPPSQRIVPKPIHPLIVIADLRQGSLDSLDQYLRHCKGTIDREVSVELRKLISGSQYRTSFRLVVIDHPDIPKSKGGRPRNDRNAKRPADLAIQQEYERQLLNEGKSYLAKEATAAKLSISIATVDRAKRKIAQAKEREVQHQKEAGERLITTERRERALARLRRESGGE